MTSPYLISMVNLESGQYYYETPSRVKIIARFKSVYFILGKTEISQTQLEAIKNAWIV